MTSGHIGGKIGTLTLLNVPPHFMGDNYIWFFVHQVFLQKITSKSTLKKQFRQNAQLLASKVALRLFHVSALIAPSEHAPRPALQRRRTGRFCAIVHKFTGFGELGL